MKNVRYQRGAAKLAQIHGTFGPGVLSQLDDIAPDLKRWIIEFAFGDVYSRPGLDVRSRQIATIASLVTQGHGGRELEAHLRGALRVGVTRPELVELLMQMALYAGFPAAIAALTTLKKVFCELDAESTSRRGSVGRAGRIRLRARNPQRRRR